MLKPLAHFIVGLACYTCAQLAAAMSFEIPVTESMANALVGAYFPQQLETPGVDVSASKPKIFILQGNRVGLSVKLRCSATASGAASDGAMLLSAAIDYDPSSRELSFIDPVIDSLVFFADDKTNRSVGMALRDAWHKQVSNPTVIPLQQLGQPGLLSDYLQDIVVRENIAYFIYGTSLF